MKATSIIEKVKTFEDACKVLGLDPNQLPVVEHLPEKDRRSIVAYYKLTIITRVLNEEWEPNFSDLGDMKFWNWFYIEDNGADAGFAYTRTDMAAVRTNASVGPRLCFRAREIAEYASRQFRDLYFEYLFIDMPKNYGK
jgi:hypothetical protein